MIIQTSIVVVHHLEILRAGLIHMLSNFFDLARMKLFEANTMKDALTLDTTGKPTLLIVELESFLLEVQVLSRFHKNSLTQLPLLALTNSLKKSHEICNSEYKFCGILSKHLSSNELNSAVDKVINGQPVYSEEISPAKKLTLLSLLEEKAKVTKREKEIFDLVLENFSSKEISELLFLSERTVEGHRYNILKKMKQLNLSSEVANYRFLR